MNCVTRRFSARLNSTSTSTVATTKHSHVSRPHINQDRTKRAKATTRPNPLKADPTRTATLRRQFLTGLAARFRLFRQSLLNLVVTEDVFGLKSRTTNPFIGNLKHPYGAVLLEVKELEVVDRIRQIHSRLFSEDVLEIENEPHVTVLYGLTTDDSNSINKTLNNFMGPVWIKLLRLSVFQNDQQDVLKIDVQSNQLEKLNRELKVLPHKELYKEYVPHLTVAYLKPGTGSKYLDNPTWLEHTNLSFDKVLYRSPSNARDLIYLKSQLLNQEPLINQSGQFKFLSDPQKVIAFREWIAQQLQVRIIGTTVQQVEDAWFKQYVEEGYKKGAGKSFDDVIKKMKLKIDPTKPLSFLTGSRGQFLRQAFGQPVAVEKVKLLTGRVFTDLKGITDTMAQVMTRTLADGLVQGKGAAELGRDLAKAVDIGKTRANTIARTEIIRAHAEGQLQALEDMGIEEVGVAVEWSTAGDNRVCPKCAPLDGVVFTVKEAHGLLPRHPNCRCAHIPANLGEDTKGQKRSKSAIEKAIKKSVKAEIPKKSKKSIAQQSKDSSWAGAKRKVSKSRPEPIL